MPDPCITLEPDQLYHILTHASGSENLFRSDENYRYFLEKYAFYIYPVSDTFAYCLMPNYLHLMVRIRTLDEMKNFQGLETAVERLSRQFSKLFHAYTKANNKMYDPRCNLFIPRLKRKLFDTNSYCTALIAYIHNNPVHHEFVSDPAEWPHSSWLTFLMAKPTKHIRQQGINWFWGSRRICYVSPSVEKQGS